MAYECVVRSNSWDGVHVCRACEIRNILNLLRVRVQPYDTLDTWLDIPKPVDGFGYGSAWRSEK
jgi:hypothetical protein